MTEKDANKKPTEPDPKDVSAGGAAPQNVIGTDARSTQPSQAEREIDPNDGIAAGGIPPRQATADPGHPATDATESKPTTCDLPVSSLDVAAGGQAPGQHQATGPQNVFADEAPSQVEVGTDPKDNVAAGGQAPGQHQATGPQNTFGNESESKQANQVEPVSPQDVAAGGQAPRHDVATGPQNTFGNEAESKQPNQVEPVSPQDVAAGTISPTKTHLASAGRTPEIISTPLDPQALGPGVDAVDLNDASQGDDVSAGAAAPAPHLDTGPDQAKDPNIKVRVNDADLTAPDQNHMLDA
ncbi:MAG: hypothetical protein ACYTE6_03230 [Planctomycetota bacterium]|jgi:hypothetical protein